MGDGGGAKTSAEVRQPDIARKADEPMAAKKAAEEMEDRYEEGSGQTMERPLSARAYIVAVQLLFEVENNELEFGSLSRRLPELKCFIQEKFGVQKLPGRLEEFKGFSYKSVLNERSTAKKGQLRTTFKQIKEHSEIFGEAVAARAGEILEEDFD